MASRARIGSAEKIRFSKWIVLALAGILHWLSPVKAYGQSDTLTAMVILIKFPEQKGPLPPSDYCAKAMEIHVNHHYGHSTKWRVKPIKFIATEYFALSRPFAEYQEGYNNLGWAPHFNLLREVMEAVADKKIMVKAKDGSLQPLDLSELSINESKQVLSIGTAYYPTDVPGRAYGNAYWWPQSDSAHRKILRNWNVTVGSYSYGFFDTVPNHVFNDPGAMQTGAMIHEIGHAVYYWPDIERLINFGNDWEFIKRVSRANKIPPHDSIRLLNDIPSGSTISVSAGHWSVWGYRNPADSNEYIILENIATKGYTKNAHVKGRGLAIHNIHLKDGKQDVIEADPANPEVTAKDLFHAGNQSEFSTGKFPKATWRDSSRLPFSISNISAAGDVMTLKFFGPTSGTPIDAGAAEPDLIGYPVELYDSPDGLGSPAAFGRTRYLSLGMKSMGIMGSTASSVRIHPGNQVVLYEKDGFTGQYLTLSSTGTSDIVYNLSDFAFDNKANSMVVAKAGSAISGLEKGIGLAEPIPSILVHQVGTGAFTASVFGLDKSLPVEVAEPTGRVIVRAEQGAIWRLGPGVYFLRIKGAPGVVRKIAVYP